MYFMCIKSANIDMSFAITFKSFGFSLDPNFGVAPHVHH